MTFEELKKIVLSDPEVKKEYDVVIGQYQAFSESLDGLQYKCHLMVFYGIINMYVQ